MQSSVWVCGWFQHPACAQHCFNKIWEISLVSEQADPLKSWEEDKWGSTTSPDRDTFGGNAIFYIYIYKIYI